MHTRRVIAALALLVLAAACDGTGGGAGDREHDGGEHGTLGGGPPGGVLVVLADREPDQLNPLTYNSVPGYHAVHLLFRPLARRDSTHSGYGPDLARAWTFENDSTLVFTLRDDVYWDDGVKVTADDVVFTIERQRDPVTASPRIADVAAVARVAARDSFTVEVVLNRTGLYTVNALLEVIAVPRHLLGDVAPAEIRNAPFGRRPVGNGFYRFGGWVAGQNLTLDANAEKPDGRAAIERIVLRFVPEMNAAVTQIMAGQGDLIAKLPPDQRHVLRTARNVEVHSGAKIRPAWIAWNTRRPPLDDVRVRRALLMGIDRQAIAEGLFGDVGEAALSPIPPILREHSPDVRPIPFDPDGARRLLAEAGFRDTNNDGVLDRGGRPLRIEVDYISTDHARRDVLVAMQSQLRNIGVDLAPRAYESSTWVQRLRDGAFTASLWGWGWGPGVVGPNAEMVFHSRSIPPNGPNFAASRHPRIDELLDRVNAVNDTAEARTIWRELEQLMIDDAVYAPIYLDPELYAVNTRFSNVRFRGLEWVDDVLYWHIDPSDRIGRDRVR